ncbi:MAG: ABC-2 family transporter protein [Spirochaetales bacterium]|nr:ABC-2 family transporter protein [Spirochaetales bacterium]
MKGILRMFGAYFRFNLSAGMAYRGAFFMQVFFMALNNSAFIVFWLILYSKIGTDIKGYQFSDVMFLWSLVPIGYGLSVVFLGNASQISQIICNGELDVYLTQPKPVLLNLLAGRMQVSGWGDIIYGFILFFAAVPFSVPGLLVLVFGGIMYGILMAAVRVIYHSLTFHFGNAEDFAQTASEMSLNFALYPESIFKGAARVMLHSIIPVAYMIFLPVSLIKAFSWRTIGTLVLADTLIIALAVLVFYRGLKRYESGNRMGSRL